MENNYAFKSLKEIRSFLSFQKTIENNLNKLYSFVILFPYKYQTVDFAMKFINNQFNPKIFKNTSYAQQSPEEMLDLRQRGVLKTPTLVTLYHKSCQHYLSSQFGAGHFADPKLLINENITIIPRQCHFTASLFTMFYKDFNPMLQTGFYNCLTEDFFDNQGYLHSIVIFSHHNESKVFDGSRGLIMDEQLYKELFNFKPINTLNCKQVIGGLNLTQFRGVNLLEYLLAPEVVIKAVRDGEYEK